MATYRRVYRPTMAHRHRGDNRRNPRGGTPNPDDPILAAALGKPVPGAARWRQSHGRKSQMLWCEALRFVKSCLVVSGGDPRCIDPRQLDVYRCEEGPAPGVPGPLHWHAGHASC